MTTSQTKIDIVSSIVNEDIRGNFRILYLFIYFFYEKILQAQKAQRRIEANKNKKGIIFMRIKSI